MEIYRTLACGTVLKPNCGHVLCFRIVIGLFLAQSTLFSIVGGKQNWCVCVRARVHVCARAFTLCFHVFEWTYMHTHV